MIAKYLLAFRRCQGSCLEHEYWFTLAEAKARIDFIDPFDYSIFKNVSDW